MKNMKKDGWLGHIKSIDVSDDTKYEIYPSENFSGKKIGGKGS